MEQYYSDKEEWRTKAWEDQACELYIHDPRATRCMEIDRFRAELREERRQAHELEVALERIKSATRMEQEAFNLGLEAVISAIGDDAPLEEIRALKIVTNLQQVNQ